MENLTRKCVSCQDATPLTCKDIQVKFQSLRPNFWKLTDENKISRTFVCKNWTSAVKFINDVTPIVESINHHPDIQLRNYREIEISIFTHSCGGLTDIDFELAKLIEAMPDIEYSPKWRRENIDSV